MSVFSWNRCQQDSVTYLTLLPPANEHVNAALKKSNRLLMVINQLGFGKSIVIFHGWERETLIRSAALNNVTRLWSYLKYFQIQKREKIINV